MEVRPTDPCVYLRTVPSPPRRYMWMRAKGHIGMSDGSGHRFVVEINMMEPSHVLGVGSIPL